MMSCLEAATGAEMVRARVPIFMFHHVAPDGPSAPRSPLVVRSSKLREIAEWFLRRGYESITVRELASLLRAGDAASLRRKFALTFDDGAKSCFEHAYPVLSEIGCTATFYVLTSCIGGSSNWRNKMRSFEMMNAEELLELFGQGFEIGSHGRNHVDLTALTVDEIDAQMVESRATLSSMIGAEVSTFAYPYGLFDARVVKAVRDAGYIAACSVLRGAAQDSQHTFALKRIMVTEGTSRLRLRYFMSGLLDFEYRREFESAVLGRQ